MEHKDAIVMYNIGYLEGSATRCICEDHDWQRAMVFFERLLSGVRNREIPNSQVGVSLRVLLLLEDNYKLTVDEAYVVSLLLTWRNLQNLEDAHHVLAIMIKSKHPPKPPNGLPNPHAHEVHVDNTGQEHPFGFESEGEIK